jgi:hypothetical protein
MCAIGCGTVGNAGVVGLLAGDCFICWDLGVANKADIGADPCVRPVS